MRLSVQVVLVHCLGWHRAFPRIPRVAWVCERFSPLGSEESDVGGVAVGFVPGWVVAHAKV